MQVRLLCTRWCNQALGTVGVFHWYDEDMEMELRWSDILPRLVAGQTVLAKTCLAANHIQAGRYFG